MGRGGVGLLMNTRVEGTLAHLSHQLGIVDATSRDYVLFGSGVMYLHSLRGDVGDLDVYVTKEVWGKWLPLPNWMVKTPRADDPPYLTFLGGAIEIHAFFDWTWRDKWMDVRSCFQSSQQVYGFSCASLYEVLRHKREAANWNIAKHIRDIPVIEHHLAEGCQCTRTV